jgi:hypothetical protein
MKTKLLTVAALGLAVLNLSAQTPAVLNLQLYAGLTLTAAAGSSAEENNEQEGRRQ